MRSRLAVLALILSVGFASACTRQAAADYGQGLGRDLVQNADTERCRQLPTAGRMECEVEARKRHQQSDRLACEEFGCPSDVPKEDD